ncbi:hypothetical protein GKR56_17280 [Providencia alcalifaciens]|uniref:hypothetical protein n=1 Tax=Providencia alcalifaciens TaxID=126385 RepID=UPI0012B58859|nr:hypothetical protein [Providencia alcalifaciens]MTC54976.1 hypothetical protein [Providencia alcalifaciens]
MDKSRQQFEETIKSLSDPSEFESKLKRANNGLNYANQHVDLMWISWKASRESLEVELPEPFIANETWCYDEDLVNQALISNGVKIKNE